MSPAIRLGFLSALGAYTIWGLLPLYFKTLAHIAPEEMLAHRILWSVPTGLILIAVASKWEDLRAVLTPARLGWLSLSAALIGINWFVYIWAVGQDRVMEASLGYYINPLVNVLIGAVFMSERLRVAQWVAVAIATIGVGIMTIAFGRVPYIALILCISFALYSVLRKRIQVDGRAGFLVEAALLAPLAAMWMVWFLGQPEGRAMGEGGWDIPLLLAAGPITAVPLILFAVAAKRLMLSTIGMMQYLGPTLQLMIALAFGERFGWSHAAGFACIWAALILFTTDSVMFGRKARRLARAAEIA